MRNEPDDTVTTATDRSGDALSGHTVLDARGDTIGRMTGVYADSAADHVDFAAVRIGHLGRRRRVLVPLAEASVGSERVRVKCGKKLAQRAPSLPSDGALSITDEQAVFTHYGLRYRAHHDSPRLHPA